MNEDFQRGPGDKVTFLIISIIIIKCDSEKSECESPKPTIGAASEKDN